MRLMIFMLSSVDASRRILLLHGSGSSAGAFLNRGAANLLGAASNAYHDGGPHAWQFDGLDWDEGVDLETNWGAWWTDDDLSTYGAESLAGGNKAIAAVEEALHTGGFNGIVGFSQGAAVAAVVAARSALRIDGAYTDLQFAVMCGGAMPTPYSNLLTELPSASTVLPTLHCLSKCDTVMPTEQGEALASCFGPNADVRWHDAGHALPPKDVCKEVIAWADAVCPEGSKYR